MLKSLEDIHAEILLCGLQADPRTIYAERYQPYFAAVGLWQQPDELAALLYHLQNYDIKSFLNIGTFNGKTFKLIADFLTARNPATVCITVDIHTFPNLVQDNKYSYHIGTSRDFADQAFDLVFIDGDHSYGSTLQDFNNVGRSAQFCVFHDIKDEFIARDLPNGGCVAAWRELKEELAATRTILEFVTKDKPCQNMGLGLIKRGQPMRRIVVTPAGRRQYLDLLRRQLTAQRRQFDEWHLWLNTEVPEDLQFCRDLEAKHSWIKTIPLSVPFRRGFSICSFFKNCVEPDTVYLRLDDDVIWLEPQFVSKMFEFRERRPEFFLVYGNIVNNAVISHIHQRAGLIDYRYGQCDYDCLSSVGWGMPQFAQYIHESFLADLENDNIDRWRCFDEWQLYLYERVSINAVAFLGSDLASFNGVVDPDEEPWLSTHYPAAAGKMCAINGAALCSHFAFTPQRVSSSFNETALLARYKKFAPT